jgi:hypothetical protein
MVWNNQRVKPDALQQKQEEAESQAAGAQSGAESSRPKAGDELRLNLAGVSKIEATAWPSSARLRHLCTNSTALAMSQEGRLAVASELTHAGRRLAVWNLDEGKLVRYLSAELDKSTRPYAGQDDADFGAKIDHAQLTRVALSPSGRRCAAMVNASPVPGSVSVIYAWDLASGKMICHYEEPHGFGSLFLMADDQHVVTSCRRMIVRLNVDTGQADLLRGPDDRTSITAGTVHNGTLALAGTYGVATISLNGREYTGYPFQKEIDVSAEVLAELGADAMAFIRQRTRLVGPRHGRANPHQARRSPSPDQCLPLSAGPRRPIARSGRQAERTNPIARHANRRGRRRAAGSVR